MDNENTPGFQRVHIGIITSIWELLSPSNNQAATQWGDLNEGMCRDCLLSRGTEDLGVPRGDPNFWGTPRIYLASFPTSSLGTHCLS